MFGISSGSFAVFWLVIMVVLLIVEAAIPGLVSIWFAAGALAALIVSFFGGPFWLQIVWFLLVSIVLLILTRPLARKYVNAHTAATNADMVIGKDCIVTEAIDNIRGTGAVSVGGKIWTARMEREEEKAEEGDIVKALRIEGVRLIVSAPENKQ